MRFRTTAPIQPPTAAAIVHAVHALDALAVVDVDAQVIRIEGGLAPEQYLRIINDAGCEARAEDTARVSGHVSGGSTCCGGCS